MGQSMHGWKADDFFFSVRQHLDSLGPRGLEDLRLALTKAATNITSVSRRLNNEHLGRILENVQATTKNLQQIDINVFHEAFKSVQHTSNVATHKLTQLDVNHLRDTFKAVQLMVTRITDNFQHLDVKGFNKVLNSVQYASNAMAHKSVHSNISRPLDTLEAFQQIANNINLATQALPKALDTFKYTLLLTGLMILLATWTFVRAIRNLNKRTEKISANIRALSTEIAPQGNLYHQNQFAAAVWNFVLFTQAQQILYPDNYLATNHPSESRYIIFHPAPIGIPTSLHKVLEIGKNSLERTKMIFSSKVYVCSIILRNLQHTSKITTSVELSRKTTILVQLRIFSCLQLIRTHSHLSSRTTMASSRQSCWTDRSQRQAILSCPYHRSGFVRCC
jgi:hypothetical protein